MISLAESSGLLQEAAVKCKGKLDNRSLEKYEEYLHERGYLTNKMVIHVKKIIKHYDEIEYKKNFKYVDVGYAHNAIEDALIASQLAFGRSLYLDLHTNMIVPEWV